MPPGSPPPPPQQPSNQVGATLPILVGGLALLLIAGIIAGAMIISSSLENDDGPRSPLAATSPSVSPSVSPSPSASASDGASPSPEPSTSEDPQHDSCLIGTWRETSNDHDAIVYGVRVRLHSSGATQHFRANGTLQINYGDGINARGKVGNRTYEVITSGRLTYDWQTGGGQVNFSNVTASATTIWRQDGKETRRGPLDGRLEPARYTCDGDSLRQLSPTRTIELQRINTAPV